jgi:hypothetical protein
MPHNEEISHLIELRLVDSDNKSMGIFKLDAAR